jgi:hypothetical protein
LLEYYGEMAAQRRDVDRGYKRRSRHRDARGQVGRTYSLKVDVADESEATPSRPFRQIADRLREDRGIICPCGATGSWDARLLGNGADHDLVAIEVECPAGDYVATIELPRAEFERVGWEVIESEGEEGPRPPRPEPGSEE